MSDELWFRFHPSKFMAGIRGLNANEVKVYICVLCRIYERGEAVKNDAETWRHTARCGCPLSRKRWPDWCAWRS